MEDLFKGKLVRLAGIDPEEVSKSFAQWNRDSEYMRLLDSDPPRLYSSKAIKEWLEKELEKASDMYWFAIRALEDDRLLGDVTLSVINWGSREAFTGIGIGVREFWGRGYGTDTMQVILRYGFVELNLRRISLNVFEFNQRALRSYEKAGFRREGRQRQFIQREGRRWDILFMGILSEEWMEIMATTFQIGDEFPSGIDSQPLEPSPSTGSAQRLKTGLKLRAARWADLEPVAQLILDVCTNDGDATVAVTPDELRSEWEAPGFNLETDAWVVTAADGRVVGYEEFVNRYAHASLSGDGYVHPDFMGMGIGTALLRALEKRARKEIELADSEHRVYIRNGMSIGDSVSRQMHENEGYEAIRFYWRMEITLEEAPPTPIWPAGIELRPFDVGAHAYLVYRAHEEAFRDHWGITPRSFEEWRHRTVESSGFDPSLWCIAWDGDQIAGYALNRYRHCNGWVGTLGVRRLWRKRGLGLALLYHSFGEFYKRGTPVINLGVDAASQTGATRLYQKAGMQVAAEYVSYEKELRPGREISVQSLTN